jgi:hypothetical protein
MARNWREIKDDAREKAKKTADTFEKKMKKDWQKLKEEF